MKVAGLDTPTLVVDLDRLGANIADMASRATSAGVRLRPHTKTHKIPEIARLQVAAGAAGITCAKVGEAEVMVDAGLDDVLIAYPVLGAQKLARLRALRERARILVSLDSVEVAEGLGALGVATKSPVEVYVEVDTGQHRLGTAPGAPTVDLARQVAGIRGLTLVGLLTHAGHANSVTNVAHRRVLIEREIDDLLTTQALCAQIGLELVEISVGSTPAARLEATSPGVTEMRPGTYVFNDTATIDHGVATGDTCALHVLATVVGRPTPERFVIDAGSKCFSSDGAGTSGWLRVAGRDDLTMEFTTEEHGVGTIDLARGGRLSIGDRLLVIPRHVCAVVNLFDTVTTTRGGEVTGELRVAGRGRVR